MAKEKMKRQKIQEKTKRSMHPKQPKPFFISSQWQIILGDTTEISIFTSIKKVSNSFTLSVSSYHKFFFLRKYLICILKVNIPSNKELDQT